MEKVIVIEDDYYTWMALNAPPDPPPAVATAAVFIVIGRYVLPLSIPSFAILK